MRITRTSVFAFATVALVTIGGLTLSAQQGYGYGQGQGQGRGRGRAVMALSGTYKLDRNQGDDPIRAAQNATRNLPENQRDTAYRALLVRLQPPPTLSIERRGRTVNMASSTNGVSDWPERSIEVQKGIGADVILSSSIFASGPF